MNKYINIIDAINNSVNEFNQYLAKDFQIEFLDKTKIDENTYYLNLINKKWDDISFPRNRDVGGVYFYFGFNTSNPNELSVYIGKASYSRVIGQRLWSHFKNKPQGMFNDNLYYIDSEFAIEMITSIPLEKEGTVFLAPALEEFLIYKLKKSGVKLFNSIGNN